MRGKGDLSLGKWPDAGKSPQESTLAAAARAADKDMGACLNGHCQGL